MKHRRFHRPVVVQPGRVDREIVVADTRLAAEILLKRWPDENCPKRQRAMRKCLAVIRGEQPPHVARTALADAAREAAILLHD